ncbi:histidine phosphatase family protein [Mucilaginibacter polytrichastri]|uniref:Histidine phosphatase family protein n=1 Tax=Mucilaginibacter polytrichastri TaxID=1302689 RepID=A0A1Q5ZTW9_9SPHI|nr:histidine phosphatase family protein [Mucilaginibacter polytrichastri]OKS85173.1 hypothetical protein RG47T_0617 [Mucilaginibacter polytrichastri]SFS43271.1 hypothetical protein SAMN04487890_101467 [Mucilaginibacter polytrichastri]
MLSSPILKTAFLRSILFLFLTIPAVVYSKPKPDRTALRIVLIRHGEKPAQGDNLSCAGFNRAIKLPAVLKSKFGIPDYIYVPAPSTGKRTTNCRMLQTIMPFAIKNNLPINTDFTVDATDLLAKKIKKQTGTVLVVWEHKQLGNILISLGLKDLPGKWKEDDFDSIYVITYPKNKAVLTVDQEGITPVGDCGF